MRSGRVPRTQEDSYTHCSDEEQMRLCKHVQAIHNQDRFGALQRRKDGVLVLSCFKVTNEDEPS